MGSPLSPVIANMVLEDLEERALNLLSYKPPFFFRYVDDVILAAPSEHIDHTVQIFNSFHHRLQFTVERGVEGSLNFLDVSIQLYQGKFSFDWYRKSTFSGRFLNFQSNHPIFHKRGVIYGLIDKVLNISDPQFHEPNIELIINLLLKNCYPLPFILDTISKRLKVKSLVSPQGNEKNIKKQEFLI